MSERIQSPRPGGRAADEKRPVAGRRDTGMSRDADAPGSAGRGARHFAGDEDREARRSDTRRSGTRNGDERRGGRDAGRERSETREARAARPSSRSTDSVRGKARDTEGVRAKARDTEGVRGKARDTGSVRAQARDTEGVRAKKRETEGVRTKRDTEGVRTKRDADGVRTKARNTEGVRRGLSLGRDRKPVVAGRGRRDVQAPVDGAVALQIEVAAAEPIRVTDEATGPRLRVAPPPPIHRGPRAPFVAGMIGVVIVGVLGILLINTKTNENSFRIADLQKQNTALENQRQDLDNQLVQVSSIGNLDAAARRLGLVRANIEDVAQLRLPDGKIINVPKPVRGATSVTKPDAVTDKGPANISPANGTNGAATNGAATNGAATNGAATNGIGTNGAATNGAATNGAATNGAGTNGAGTNGAGTAADNTGAGR